MMMMMNDNDDDDNDDDDTICPNMYILVPFVIDKTNKCY